MGPALRRDKLDQGDFSEAIREGEDEGMPAYPSPVLFPDHS